MDFIIKIQEGVPQQLPSFAFGRRIVGFGGAVLWLAAAHDNTEGRSVQRMVKAFGNGEGLRAGAAFGGPSPKGRVYGMERKPEEPVLLFSPLAVSLSCDSRYCGDGISLLDPEL